MPLDIGCVRLGVWSEQQMSFKIDLIGTGDEVNKQIKDAQVTGSMIAEMISVLGRAQKPKPKCSYDHTDVSRQSVRFAGVMCKMSKGIR